MLVFLDYLGHMQATWWKMFSWCSLAQLIFEKVRVNVRVLSSFSTHICVGDDPVS